MSWSDSVPATLVMLPASLVRRLRLEVLQLLHDVLVVLPGDARDLVLPDEAAEVAHRAQHLVRLLAARPRPWRASALKPIRRRLLLRELVGQREHVVARQVAWPSASSADRCAGLP